ncbi:uncharacterized protein [Amphiura filiformis]|uniref:uncharacterized protein n=1 Tax=Amphiura filiformis TaxID=82378 RepID=UPI003B2277D4
MASSSTRRTRRYRPIATFLVLAFIVFCALYILFIRGEKSRLQQWLRPVPEKSAYQNPELKLPPTKRRKDKISNEGVYLQYCGFTTISMCHNIETLKYIEDFIQNNRVLRKCISPLPYTSYHMTTYDIYSNAEPPIKFVQDWLDGDQTRTATQEKCIPTEDVYPIMKSAQQVWDKTGNKPFTVETEYLKRGAGSISIRVAMDDTELIKKFDDARLEANKVFSKIYIYRRLHITLGYFYANFQDLPTEEQAEFELELDKLEQQILPKRFTLNPPVVTSFASMAQFIPIVDK